MTNPILQWSFTPKESLILAKVGSFMDLKTEESSDLKLQLQILAQTQEKLPNMLEKPKNPPK